MHRSRPGIRSSFVAFAAPAVIALVAVLGACGSEDDSGGATPRGAPENPGDGTGTAAGEPTQNELIGDAAPPSQDLYRGSPLCHITASSCDPDEVKSCGWDPNPDAGMTSAPKGCRVTGTGATASPACGDANKENTDGAKCQVGADCAPGFDCVTSNDVGYCRRYCCSGSCGTHRSQNGTETFCDLQKLQASQEKVPVCMPIKSCKLFLEGECADNETCSVVTDDGTTGCVANGNAKAGESCDDEHCSVGLTCLGQAGNRKCFQLCRTTKNGPSCAPSQVCKTSTIFMDPTIGVCAAAQ